MKSEKTIHIVDDHSEICHSLRGLFESVHYNVETYESAGMFLEKRKNANDGCLVTDVRMPGMSGLELLEQLKLQNRQIPAIVITGYGDIQMAVRAMKAGAYDFVLKPLNPQCFLETVQKCIQQATHTCSSSDTSKRIESLSEREHQIMEMIMDGKLTKEIAYDLSISISTVEAYRAKIMKKMEAKNLAQLIKKYLHSKWVEGSWRPENKG